MACVKYCCYVLVPPIRDFFVFPSDVDSVTTARETNAILLTS